MGKLVRVKKKMLKISAKDWEKILRTDEVSKNLLDMRIQEIDNVLKKSKEDN